MPQNVRHSYFHPTVKHYNKVTFFIYRNNNPPFNKQPLLIVLDCQMGFSLDWEGLISFLVKTSNRGPSIHPSSLPAICLCSVHFSMFLFSFPVRAVQGRPVLGHRSCRGCTARGGQGLAAGCPGPDQRSRTEDKSHLTHQLGM